MMDDFSLQYDDWMLIDGLNIRENYMMRDLANCLNLKYTDKCEMKDRLFNKCLVAHQKIAMMMYSYANISLKIREFEMSQNMDIPAFYGMASTAILFYAESMIIYARNALDVIANVLSDILINKREDSFNELTKSIMKSQNGQLKSIKDFILRYNTNQYIEVNSDGLSVNVYRLLCGNEKGRAIRDIVIHQSNLNLFYDEYKKNSEKEKLFINIGNTRVPFIQFVELFVSEYETFINNMVILCNQYLKEGGQHE